MKVGVVGAGGVGKRRAAIVAEDAGATLAVVVDIDAERARAVADAHDAEAATDWRAVVARPGLDVIIVSASNDLHAPIAIAAMEAGKHVLVEKPLARTPDEAQTIVAAAARTGRVCQTGFNHRFFPAVWRAHERVRAGEFGRVLWLRGRYGHRGTYAIDKGWFVQPQVSGGGTFLDNGVHFLDLFRWFLGDFVEASGFVGTLYWDRIAPVEDNGFGAFRTGDGRVAALHASWTQWASIFSLEIGCAGGILHCSSGTKLDVQKRGATWDALELATEDFQVATDASWRADWREFCAAIAEGRAPLATATDGWQAVRMAYAVYAASRTGMTQRL